VLDPLERANLNHWARILKNKNYKEQYMYIPSIRKFCNIKHKFQLLNVKYKQKIKIQNYGNLNSSDTAMNKHVMSTIFKQNNTDSCLVNVNNKWIYIIIINIINLISDIIIRAHIFFPVHIANS
jgi:hypothetical protein